MIGFLLWASQADAAKTSKFDKAFAAVEAGEGDEAWVEAREALDKLLEKSPDDPALRVREARLWLAAAARGVQNTGAVPLERALGALEAAKGVDGEVRAQAEGAAAQLASSLVAELTNLVDGKQWADAAVVVGWCGRAFAVGEALGVRDADRTATFEKLATRVAVQANDLAAAREHYGRLQAATGVHDGALANKIAKKMAEKDAAEARAFLTPILDAAPTDEALLRAWLDLALQGGATEEAVARLDAAAAELSTSKSGAVLLGELYGVCGRKDKARAAYEALLQAEPANIPANTALARFWLASARDMLSQLSPEARTQKPTKETAKVLAAAAVDLGRAEQHARSAVAADEQLASSWELLVEVLGERRALAAEPKTPAEKDAVKAVDDALVAARAKLSALQEGP